MSVMKIRFSMEMDRMKITRILPKQLAVAWQKYDLNKIDGLIEYHRAWLSVLEQRSEQGHQELERLGRTARRYE